MAHGVRSQSVLHSAYDLAADTRRLVIAHAAATEWDGIKNLATESNIAGAAIAGSDRASDLHMKLD